MERGKKECKRPIDISHKKQAQTNPRHNQTVVFKNGVQIIGGYSIVGQKEGGGPLKSTFSKIMEDEYFGEKTHEAAEQKMFEYAIRGAIKSAGLERGDVDMMFSGDLLNQITSSSFAARSFDMMFIGIYGACSTMALTLGIASCLVEAGFIKNAVVSAGSHFATAERQYRTPLELGNQKPPNAQWTVTGVGASVLTSSTSPSASIHPRVTSVTFGKVCDWGVKDVNNMGAAMAPSAAHTLIAHFRDTNTKPEDYCHIFTGDLGKLGENICRDLLANANYPVDANYTDCGRLIYGKSQNQYQGGSGCGCSAVCLNGFILNKLRKGEYKKILFVGTGALLSPVASFQGNTVPGISHCVCIES
ncbi:MAG: stage V sporulation protein AD [Firmicutes bacterium]|nr:stage V sporulation protein AD [Bacillota bacterium]